MFLYLINNPPSLNEKKHDENYDETDSNDDNDDNEDDEDDDNDDRKGSG